MSVLAACTWLFAVLVPQPRAYATFHLWDINEVFSNADGSVQFIELITTFNNQQFTTGRVINAIDNGVTINTFTFPGDTPSPTANHHLLLATPGFAALPGAVTPDFILPAAPFFNPASPATTIDFVFADLISFTNAQLPVDGVLSLNRSGINLVSAANSPTNYAGQTGSLNLASLDGDLDGDGFVGIADLNIVLGNWNQNVTAGDLLQGDPSGDGFVGIEDLNEILGNWNAGTPPITRATIPEPSSLIAFQLGLLALTSTRRSRWSMA